MATTIPPSPAPPTTPPASAAVEPQKVDYLNLPCPIPYEEIQREALMSLKPELFEGMRFDFTKGLNQKFSLSHSVMMGPTEVPSQSSEIFKVPTAHYEFGANFIDPKLMLFGRVMTDGRLNARLKCDLTENLTLKGNAQLTNEPHMSHGMFNFDYKGSDYRTQFQLGDGALFGASYIQCRLRGKIDSNGVVAALLEERFNMGLNFLLSAEIDHVKKDYKFGFGLTVGE
ncbi:hypothetical protein CDL12_19460 [Handroanthus impetiginosus]|uniref:Uncharacterized protein n=1 Tax=Handroanthus impetiginosus TaxID=429701 RepID=A0A2G9GRP7_9LAMI|nr:hypothetical protein CDL12_19460 [Handroanthus impetiginosus]